MAKRPRATWRPTHEVGLNNVFIERVLNDIAAEGRQVEGLWYPDRDPKDPRIAGRRPVDGAFTVDGQEAGIDMTRSFPRSVAEPAARAGRTASAAASKTRALRLGVGISMSGKYDLELMRARKDGPRHDADVVQITRALVAEARRGAHPQAPMSLDGLPDWVTEANVSVTRPPHSIVTIWFSPPCDPARVPERLDEIAESKGKQLAGWGLGVVGVIHGHSSMERMAKAVNARGMLPFWRLYWCDAGRNHLLWDRDA